MRRETEHRIEHGLRALAQEQPHPGQMDRMLAAARRRADGRRSGWRGAQRTALATGAIALIAAALLLIPISYEFCVGTVVHAAWQTAQDDPTTVAAALAGVPDLVNGSVNLNGPVLSAQMLFRGVAAGEAKERALACLEPVLGAAVLELSCREIKRRVGGNALAAMTGGVIRVNAAGLSDREIEAAIAAELAAWGAGGSEVQVLSGPDGERAIEVLIEDPPQGQEAIKLEVIR